MTDPKVPDLSPTAVQAAALAIERGSRSSIDIWTAVDMLCKLSDELENAKEQITNDRELICNLMDQLRDMTADRDRLKAAKHERAAQVEVLGRTVERLTEALLRARGASHG